MLALKEKTFYLAASSHDIARVRALAEDFHARGYTWWHDWTHEDSWDADKASWPTYAALDVQAARAADVFVMLGDVVSPGAFLELGVRLALPKQAHVVGGDHFFFSHPFVTKHDSWTAFLTRL